MHLRPVFLVPLLTLAACAADRPAAQRAPGPAPAAVATPPARPGIVSPEGIRLPRTFRPAAQRVWLTVDPSADGFSGRTEIDGTLDAPTDVIWLNADVLEFGPVVARAGTEEVPADPVVRSELNGKIQFQEQKRKAFLKSQEDFKRAQAESLNKMGISSKDLGTK